MSKRKNPFGQRLGASQCRSQRLRRLRSFWLVTISYPESFIGSLASSRSSGETRGTRILLPQDFCGKTMQAVMGQPINEFSSVSPGDQPLAKEPADSEHKVGLGTSTLAKNAYACGYKKLGKVESLFSITKTKRGVLSVSYRKPPKMSEISSNFDSNFVGKHGNHISV